jgi:hypothetical protein
MSVDAAIPPALTAMSLGKQIDPFDAWNAVNIDCRIGAGDNDVTHEFLDRTTQRLCQAWPDLPR